MYEAVFDASALIAYLRDEFHEVEDLENLLPKSIISSVNACEIATVLARIHMPIGIIQDLVDQNIGKIISFDYKQAIFAANLWKMTQKKGLSLGDRACLSLGIHYKLPIYTADKIWKELNIEGLEIRLIR